MLIIYNSFFQYISTQVSIAKVSKICNFDIFYTFTYTAKMIEINLLDFRSNLGHMDKLEVI